ncbi:biotin--[acetyl-CoA-carboxylase] ligase [Naumannella huperziae]
MSASPPGAVVDPVRLRAALSASAWPELSVVDRTGSTNADLLAAAAVGDAAPGAVLIAGHQTAGRGRLARAWTAPPWTSVATSVLLAPRRPVEDWGWLSMIVGLAVATGIREATGLAARLKWPNDVLLDGRKVCGILGQRVPGERPASVVGFGLNTTMTAAELPVPTAISLDLAAAAADIPAPDPTDVLAAILGDLAARLARWDDGADPRPDYLALSDTVGRRVRVELPGGAPPAEGEATGVDAGGRIVVHTVAGPRAFGAGDIVHLRPGE